MSASAQARVRPRRVRPFPSSSGIGRHDACTFAPVAVVTNTRLPLRRAIRRVRDPGRRPTRAASPPVTTLRSLPRSWASRVSDQDVEYLLGEILHAVRGLAAGQDELLTKEQAAARLTVSLDRLDKWMRDGTLPKGIVWFQPPGLPVRISWAALCEHYRSATGPNSHRTAAHGRGEDADEERVPHWRDSA